VRGERWFERWVFCANLPGGEWMNRFSKWLKKIKPFSTGDDVERSARGSASEAAALRVVNPHEPLEVQPTAARVVAVWVLFLFFVWGTTGLFNWVPPYAYETVKNLKGFPSEWVDLLLTGAERFLIAVAFLSTLLHTLWRTMTTYSLSDQEIVVKTWVPIRRVESIPLSAVKRVGFTQGWVGYALDYGHVEIDLGGATGPLMLRNCPKPEAFLRELRKRLSGGRP
jgi:hypothetical protein